MPTTVQRRTAILALLDRDGSVRNSDLASTLGVASKTIRLDLQALARHGHITHVRGGAIANLPARHRGVLGEDAAIALHAARLVAPCSTLGLGAGPITLVIARALARTPGLTVVTASPAIALAFDDHEAQGQQIVLIGGLATDSGGCVGPIALTTIRQLALDQLILQAGALDADRGLLSPSHLQAETDRALIDATDRLTVVANHTAWNAVSLAPLAPLSAATTLITSTSLSIEAQDAARAVVPDLHLVSVRGDGSAVLDRHEVCKIPV